MTRRFASTGACLLLLTACLRPVDEARHRKDGGLPDAASDASTPTCDRPCGGQCCEGAQVCVPVSSYCCTPQCAGKQCGSDGCGGSCGTCPAGRACTPAGDECVACKPDCTGRICGSDRCGGSCGTCDVGLTCTPNGQCVTCGCQGRQCGDDGCGNNCGGCPPYLGCSENGICVACNPVCLPGERCDVKQVPPVCVEICNPPRGCRVNWEVCNPDTSQCEPLHCGTQACEFGQGCFDPATNLPGTSCTCLPRRRGTYGTSLPDTCAPYGKICGAVPGLTTAARCRLPVDQEACTAAVGCADGLDCVSVPSGESVCLRRCTTTASCPLPTDACISQSAAWVPVEVRGHCWWNVCAFPPLGASERANYFGVCDAQGGDDGACLPFELDVVGWSGDVGVCVQGGVANGRCIADARRPSTANMCPSGQFCDPIQPDPAGGIVGLCREACNAAPSPSPVRTCTPFDICLEVAWPSGSPGSDEARLGLCEPACSMLGADTCAPDALSNATTCFQAPSWDGRGYCRPTLPSPGSAGAACAYAPNDTRNPCGERLFCLEDQPSGRCVGTCDIQTCAPSRPCPTCRPANTTCVSMGGADHRLGVCR